MPLVNIHANVHVNTDHVGKVSLDVDLVPLAEGGTCRTNLTKVFDATGSNVLYSLETKITMGLDDGVRTIVDNKVHGEIVCAIKECRDAKTYQQLSDEAKQEMQERAMRQKRVPCDGESN